MPQPNFVPVSPRSVRRTQSKVRSGATLILTGCPLRRKETVSGIGGIGRPQHIGGNHGFAYRLSGCCEVLGRMSNYDGMKHRSFARKRLPLSARTVEWIDRKSTRLNSSHLVISYAVFCLKKKTR